jgi:serine protease Do
MSIIKKIIILFFVAIVIISCNKTSNNTDISNLNNDYNNQTEYTQPPNIKNLFEFQNQLHNIAKNETPAVVFISTEKIITQRIFNPFDFFNDPFFNDNSIPREKKFKQTALGSGVIFEKQNDNYFIITNSHVVEQADSIQITVDQSKSYKGILIGTDPQVDIAIIKIKTNDPLKVAKLGNSNNVQVGDFVIAIGNPFGLSGSMSFGIVSALGRTNLQTDRLNLSEFIQTDAAINPGNSGGPLINIQGEVIGINSMIYSQSGGNIGIGFAIPINIAKNTANQLLKKGKVEHGFLGIQYRDLSEDDIKTLGIKNISNGIIVLSVVENSPASKADIKTGDVIYELDNKPFKRGTEFAIKIGNKNPGTKITLTLLRENNKMIKTVILGNRDENKISQDNKSPDKIILNNYGMEVSDLSNDIRNNYNIPDNIKGVVITDIDPQGTAAESGINVGDVIYKINNNNISNINDIKKILDNNNQTNYFFIYRKNKTLIIVM